MDSIIKVIIRPEFYVYLKLNKYNTNTASPLLNSIVRRYCRMCYFNNAVRNDHINLEKRLKFINRSGCIYSAGYLCRKCATLDEILLKIYHNENIKVFRNVLTLYNIKNTENINYFIISQYLNNSDKFSHRARYDLRYYSSRLIYLLDNTSATTYNWTTKWNHKNIPLLLERGNKINTSKEILKLVSDRNMRSALNRLYQLELVKHDGMFDLILNLDYLGDANKIIAILQLSKFVKIKVDEKTNLGKLVLMLRI